MTTDFKHEHSFHSGLCFCGAEQPERRWVKTISVESRDLDTVTVPAKVFSEMLLLLRQAPKAKHPFDGTRYDTKWDMRREWLLKKVPDGFGE
jgi:hypothetical protein